MRHRAQVARGRCSSGSCTPSFTTSSCARPSVRCRKPSGSNSGCGVCQNAFTITCCVTCAARAPWACPPMPSTTSSRAAFSATATATRSWFSSRPPSRLMSAYSTRKKKSMHLLDLSTLISPVRRTGVATRLKQAYARERHSSDCQADRQDMIASMTGFARRETTGEFGTLVCELRSVNHRFLEAGFRLPDELRAAEGELRARLTRQLRRGKVDCTITYRRPPGPGGALEVDPVALERVLAAVHVVARTLREPAAAVNAVDVLRWPGVLREDGGSGEQLLAAAYAVFGGTLEELAAARAREGARLRELLEQRCAGLEALVAGVRARLPEVHSRMRARLDERLAELRASVDPERLEQELALLLQRLDVDEELERLAGHISEVRRVIGASEPAGRRLDFLMQELNREANTLSSKSQDLETTRSAVDMKVLIEQMREQVQNAE